VIPGRVPNHYSTVHGLIARWIAAVLAVGFVVLAAHVATTDSSHAVAAGAPLVVPVRRAPPVVRSSSPLPAAAPATTMAASRVSAPPASAAEVSEPDVVVAQPISFVTDGAPTETTKAPTRSIALYGDSLTVMAWDHYVWITANDVSTDGHRYDGTQLSNWRDSILSNPNDRLVLALGTNDAVGDGAAPWADLLNKLPASKCIVWPKPYEGGSKVKLFNTQMAAIVAAHPNVHVIDWNARVQAHPEWVQYDHTHYLPDGSNQYAEMLKQAALTCP
jgi:hypothetical protein